MQVPGARKVWGTYPLVVSAAMKKLTTVGDKEIKVIQRFMRYPHNMPRWWFVLKSDEDVVLDLEMQWNEIEL